MRRRAHLTNGWFTFSAGTMAGLLVVVALAAPLTACKDDTMTDAIYEVKRQNEADLMALPGVVSVGIGRGPNGQPAIIVGMESAAEAGARRVPSEINGYPVVIQKTGKLKAQ